METSLVATKFYVPPARANLVDRPRLLSKLKTTLEYSLVVISAPAGFGKTTLISEWVRKVQPEICAACKRLLLQTANLVHIFRCQQLLLLPITFAKPFSCHPFIRLATNHHGGNIPHGWSQSGQNGWNHGSSSGNSGSGSNGD